MLDLVILFLEVSLLFCDNKTTCSIILERLRISYIQESEILHDLRKHQ